MAITDREYLMLELGEALEACPECRSTEIEIDNTCPDCGAEFATEDIKVVLKSASRTRSPKRAAAITREANRLDQMREMLEDKTSKL